MNVHQFLVAFLVCSLPIFSFANVVEPATKHVYKVISDDEKYVNVLFGYIRYVYQYVIDKQSRFSWSWRESEENCWPFKS